MLTGCLENYFPEKKPPNDAIATSNLLSKFISHSVSALAKLKFGEQASHCHCVCTDQIWEKRDGLGVRNLPTHNGRSRRHNHDQQRPNGKKNSWWKKNFKFQSLSLRKKHLWETKVNQCFFKSVALGVENGQYWWYCNVTTVLLPSDWSTETNSITKVAFGWWEALSAFSLQQTRVHDD